MKQVVISFVLFVLFCGVVGVLFSHWWRARTISLSLPSSTASPAPARQASSQLLSYMAPLRDDEKTIELDSGLIRYHVTAGKVFFTIFVVWPGAVPADLRVYVLSGKERQLLGTLREGKGGWLLDGSLPVDRSPFVFTIGAPGITGKLQV